MKDSEGLGCSILVWIIFGLIWLVNIASEKGYLSESILIVTLVVSLLFSCLYYRDNKKLKKEMTSERSASVNERIRLNKTISEKECELKEKTKKLDKLIKVVHSTSPFTASASLYADVELIIFSQLENDLRYKKHPAKSSAETVKYLRGKSRKYIEQYKEMLYKYEFLLKSFPELEKYVDDYEALKAIAECKTYSEIEDGFDRVSDYVSKEEWLSMSVDKRNQLALDRYKEREKSNWIIGIEYEMYIDHLLRSCGFSTIHFGIKEGLNDLGRDIIAKKNGKYYIIQCKNWSKKKEIHENVVCQLFGTTLEYKIEKSQKMPGIDWDKKVFSVLYTTTKLSDTAMKFADKLGVKVIVKEKGDYPMIKCNIGKNKERIYHLPFDQQYYKVLIEEEKGEFYAWTIEQAVKEGFRRAYKFNGYAN